MNRLGVAAFAIALGLSACQRDDEAISKKLDDISRRLTGIEGKIGSAPAAAGAAAAGRPQQRNEPNPTHVYAVPVGESAFIGPKDAKVTMIEAFTFT